MALGVDEASQAYERAMRNIVAAGPGVCRVCWRFMDPDFETCYRCAHQPDCLDAMVPITYSEHLGQMHLALRNYKDANSTAIRRHDAIRLSAISGVFYETTSRASPVQPARTASISSRSFHRASRSGTSIPPLQS